MRRFRSGGGNDRRGDANARKGTGDDCAFVFGAEGGGDKSSAVTTADRLALFGWLRGTVVSVGDLTEPAAVAKSKDMRESNMAESDTKLIKGATGDWEVIVGLEVHAQVNSRAKLFSGASTEFGGAPNDHVSLVDAAMPGMLPVINRECVAQAVRTGLALKAKINRRSTFDRKNYFYPDLPQGYQISQYKSPIVGEGEIQVDLSPERSIRVGVERLHLEQDAGKSLHDQSPTMSFVDLNRSGVALMEIVSKPDMRSAEEARAYVSKLRSVLRYVGSSDGDMEKGNLRADVNVSVRRPGEPLGTRCEIKNVNSIRFIGQAIEVEARRQIAVIEDGGAIDQETRLFDPVRGETRSMRSKEEAHDYRYFPDPDLLPLELDRLGSTPSPPVCPNCPTPRRPASSPNTDSPPTTRPSSSPTGRRPISSRPRSNTAARRATPRRSPTG